MNKLVAIGGLSGSGKSTLAGLLSKQLNARLLRSDVMRKHYFNVAETEKLPAEAYTPAVSEQIYTQMFKQAGETIKDKSVILDAAFLKQSERQEVERLHAPFYGFWVEVPNSIALSRIQNRKVDASDATAAVRLKQQDFYEQVNNKWHVIDGTESVETSIATMLKSITANK